MAKSRTISFRLRSPFLEKLTTRAKDRDITVHECARQLLQEALEEQAIVHLQEDVEAMREDLATLAEELSGFRADFKSALPDEDGD